MNFNNLYAQLRQKKKSPKLGDECLEFRIFQMNGICCRMFQSGNVKIPLLAVMLLLGCIGDSQERKVKYTLKTDVENIEHIQHHLKHKVSEEAIKRADFTQFHLFNLYDIDKNGVLDGCELIKVTAHQHNHNTGGESPIPTDDELEMHVDTLLHQYDTNGDGYIDYAEYTIVANKQ